MTTLAAAPVDGGGAPAEPAVLWWLPLAGIGVVLVVVAIGVFLMTGKFFTILALKWKAIGFVLVAVPVLALAVWVARSDSWVKAIAIASILAWVGIVVARRSRSSSTVTRWGNRSRRAQGVATTGQIARHASAAAMRRKATTVRPSLAQLHPLARAATPAREFAVLLARSGWARLWASVEDVTLVFGGPRTGKSGYLAARIIDAPGACVVTSTRRDLHDITHPLRSRKGPVYVFNPVGLAGLPSTVTFDPLIGCADPVTAADRAGDLLAAATTSAGSGDREFWEQQARRVLAALLHAAALGERRTMRDVLRWVAAPDKAQTEVSSLLRRSPEPSYVLDATQFLTTNDRTRSSITSSIMPALGWLTSPAAVAASSGAAPLDVAALLAERGTIHLLGSEESQVAPLVCALTGHIAREARRLADASPGGRLDPPLQLDLDEAALICPIPLPRWSADMGGRGITIFAAFQSRAQVEEKWGRLGRGVLLTNAGAIMLFGGTRDEEDLRAWSAQAGTREVKRRSEDRHGKPTGSTVQTVEVLPPATLANLPPGHVVVFRRGLHPVVGRVRMAWKRRDVKRAARRRWATATRPTRERVTVGEAVGERG